MLKTIRDVQLYIVVLKMASQHQTLVHSFKYAQIELFLIFLGKKDVLELLLKSGANVNIPDDFGRAPLHFATAFNSKC